MRILVVDDYRPFATSLERLLAADHQVVLAAGGRDALALLEHDRAFDVLLVDLHMPEVTGLDVLAQLQAHAPELAARVAFLTGGAPGAALPVPGAATPSLEKPFDEPALRALLSRFELQR